MNRAALASVLWQAVGSAATLAAALVVAWRWGLGAQGAFGSWRAWADALAVAAAFGAPQALLHLRYREQVAVRALQQWIARRLRALLMLAALLALMASVAHAWGPVATANRAGVPASSLVLLLMSTPLAAGLLFNRALLLSERGPVAFGVATALPALVVAAGVAALVVVGGHGAAPAATTWPALLALASAVAWAGSAWALRDAAAGAPRHDVVAQASVAARVGAVARHSAWQMVLAAATPALLLAVVGARLRVDGVAAADALVGVGRASLALHAYQALTVLAGHVAPLVYDRAARAADLAPSVRARRHVRLGMALALGALWAACAVAWGVAPPRAQPWVAGVAAVAPAAVLAFGVRWAQAILQAAGAYRWLSGQAAVRLGGLLLLFVALPSAWAVELRVALALLVVEAASWASMERRWHDGGSTGGPPRDAAAALDSAPLRPSVGDGA